MKLFSNKIFDGNTLYARNDLALQYARDNFHQETMILEAVIYTVSSSKSNMAPDLVFHKFVSNRTFQV